MGAQHSNTHAQTAQLGELKRSLSLRMSVRGSSKQRRYEAIKLNQLGNATEGTLEVTSSMVIFGAEGFVPIEWPFSSLLRYRCDASLFKLEASSDCDAPGPHLFESKNSQKVFHHVEKHLKRWVNRSSETLPLPSRVERTHSLSSRLSLRRSRKHRPASVSRRQPSPDELTFDRQPVATHVTVIPIRERDRTLYSPVHPLHIESGGYGTHDYVNTPPIKMLSSKASQSASDEVESHGYGRNGYVNAAQIHVLSPKTSESSSDDVDSGISDVSQQYPYARLDFSEMPTGASVTSLDHLGQSSSSNKFPASSSLHERYSPALVRVRRGTQSSITSSESPGISPRMLPRFSAFSVVSPSRSRHLTPVDPTYSTLDREKTEALHKSLNESPRYSTSYVADKD